MSAPDTAPDFDAMRDSLPESMQAARRWLLWRYVPNEKPGGKPRKVPHYASGDPRSGQLDEQTDCARLVGFEDAARAFRADRYTGLGFALGPDGTGNHWQGIDLDDVSDRPELGELVQDLPGYTETSPSGRGYHAIGYGADFPSLGSNGSGIEAYAHGRFFTVTGDNAGIGEPCDLSGFVMRTLTPRHKRHNAPADPPEGTKAATVAAEVLAELRSALTALRADDRDLWQRMGHALKTIGEQGRALWLEWSQTSEKYDPADAARVWDSLTPTNTSHKAVFTAAQSAGWLNPRSKAGQASNAAPDAANIALVEIEDVLQSQPPAPGYWITPHLPAEAVTLLGAHGGTGKSMLALVAAVCMATGEPFMGQETKPARVAFFSAEDPASVLRWRLSVICRSMGIDPATLAGRLLILDATNGDPTLYKGQAPDSPTPAYTELLRLAENHAADVFIIDNASDTFDADEIRRAEVRKFVRLLAKLTKANGGAVLLLVHIDRAAARGNGGAKDGGYSGSTAWHNSARSRLFLAPDGETGDLLLTHEKNNLGPKAEPIRLTWIEHGMIVQAGASPDCSPLLASVTRNKVLRMLAEFYDRGEFVSPNPNARNNAHKSLRSEPGFPRELSDAQKMWSLLRELERGQFIERESYRTPERKSGHRWRVTDAGRAVANIAPPEDPPAPTAPTARELEPSAERAGGAPSAPTAQGGMGGERAHKTERKKSPNLPDDSAEAEAEESAEAVG